MRDERHRYGQHYTPPDVARLLAAFAVRSAADLVLDPSCGDGRLLKEALKAKKALASGRARKNRDGEVFGIDRSRSAIHLAAAACAQVAASDFFGVEPGAELDGSFRLPRAVDAVVGNPPYIRQEIIGKRDKLRIESRLEKDRRQSSDLFWPQWSRRSDIYVYFFAHAACFVREGGRLVFLTASSWLDVAYGQALREFLLNNFRLIAIIESAAESFFADASINTAITVLERESCARARAGNLVRFVRLTRPLSAVVEASVRYSRRKGTDGPRAIAREIARVDQPATTDAYRVRVVKQSGLTSSSGWGAARAPSSRRAPVSVLSSYARADRGAPPVHGSGWGKYLRAEDVFFDVLEHGRRRLRPLSGVARVRFGVKTGANEFFYVTGEQQPACGPQSECGTRVQAPLASVRRGLTTGANEFFYLTRSRRNASVSSSQSLIPVLDASGGERLIESQFLAPVVFSLKEIPGIALDRVDSGKLFFHCRADRDQLEGTCALEYIESGERAGYDARPTCAAREPWYSVADGRRPAPLIFPSKVGERWLVAINRVRVFEDKKLYGIFPARGVPKLALAALLNSTWARYFAEITCRQMTGAQAIADIDVAVAEGILIPDPCNLSTEMKGKLETALIALTRRPVYSIFEEVKRADRRLLDVLTLRAIGVSDSVCDVILEKLHQAATGLVRSRLARAIAN